MTVAEKILTITKRLYPTGRAFRMPVSGWSEKMHKGLIVSEERAWNDAKSVLDSALPDNSNFTEQDATDWEIRLGLITNPLVPLSDRKLAITRKINHPGTIKARQHYLYLQGQLRAAGFDVYVFENRFSDGLGGYYTKTPVEVVGEIYGSASQHGTGQHGDFQHSSGESIAESMLITEIEFGDIQHDMFQHGDQQHSTGVYFEYNNKIVNHIDENLDLQFRTYGSHLKNSFFIGGNPIGTFADVDINRKSEFRQLILKIKPAHAIGFLFINYI
jgi:hypothetical protein